jgi:hypothetical protein
VNRQISIKTSVFVIYVSLLVAISLFASPRASKPAFAQGTTESDAASAEVQGVSELLELISTIQSLLNQAAVE